MTPSSILFSNHRFGLSFAMISLTALFVLAAPATSLAQLPPLGTQTVAHTSTPQQESEASVAMDQNGNYVVSWSGFDAGNNYGIYFQLFNRRGVAVGSPTLAATQTAGIQQDSAVSMADDGRFVIVWEDNSVRGGNNYDVYMRVFSANGNPATSPIKVNTTDSGVSEQPRVSMNRATGDFVVVFHAGANQTDIESYYRRFNSTGTALDASQIRVSSAAVNNKQGNPSVAVSTNGTFVVAWEGLVGSTYATLFRRYTFSTGVALDAANVSALSLGGQDVLNADVAIENDGNFVIGWLKTFTNPSDLMVRRFNSAGTAQGTETAFVSGAAGGGGFDSFPRFRIAMQDNGDYVIVYSHDIANNTDSYIVSFNANGSAKGTATRINTATTALYQGQPRVAINPNGNRCIAVYAGNGAADANGAYFQRYAATNTAPALTAIGSKSVNELVTLSFTASATNDATNQGDTITYSLGAGFPSGASINSSTGAFSWTPTEAQGPGSYPIAITATDNGEPTNLSASETITVTVNEVNQAPTGLALSANTVTENSPVGTTIGTLSASDADSPAQTLSYSFAVGTGDTDNARFTLTGNTLKINEIPNYETKTSYSVRVQVTDNGSPVLSASQSFSINVTNVDETAPVSAATVVDNTLAGTNQITVNFTAADVESSGLASSSLYVRPPASGTYASTGVPQTGASGSFTYTAATDGIYQFYTRAIDNVGNTEAAPASPDVIVTINIDANSSMSLTAQAASGNLVFPMTSTINATLSLTGATIGDVFEVSRKTPLAGSQPAYFPQPARLLNEALTVAHTGPGTFTASLLWNYDPTNAPTHGTSPIDTAYKFDAGAQPTATFNVTPSANTITIPGLTSFSTFYASQPPLAGIEDYLLY